MAEPLIAVRIHKSIHNCSLNSALPVFKLDPGLADLLTTRQ